METETLALATEIDFSMLALFARATFTVKVVMILLLLASFWSWAIIIQKFLNHRRARTEGLSFDEAFWSGEPLDELYEKIGEAPQGASQRIFSSGMLEWRRSHRQDGALIAGAQARIDRSMDVAIAKEAEELYGGLSFLATVGSSTASSRSRSARTPTSPWWRPASPRRCWPPGWGCLRRSRR
jgi:biopolymer transport protein TolQ